VQSLDGNFCIIPPGHWVRLTLSSCALGGVGAGKGSTKIQQYPISPQRRYDASGDDHVSQDAARSDQAAAFQVEQYGKFGLWQLDGRLATSVDAENGHHAKELQQAVACPKTKLVKLLYFFLIFTSRDKEAPNQLIYFQQAERYAYNNTSIYSPVMMYTRMCWMPRFRRLILNDARNR